jgi:hypothetical protein
MLVDPRVFHALLVCDYQVLCSYKQLAAVNYCTSVDRCIEMETPEG